MQHHGYPSPCIDFTTCPLISLYFAFKDSTKYLAEAKEINKYVSFYYISMEDTPIIFHNYGNSFREALLARNIFKGENHNFSLNNYKAFESMFLLKDPVIFDLKQDLDYAALNNKNIINQEGLLLLIPNDEYSFEDTVLNMLIRANAKNWLPIKCINLNKGLKDHVFHFLEMNGINKEIID